MNNAPITTITIPDQTTNPELFKFTTIFSTSLKENARTDFAMTPLQIQNNQPRSNSAVPTMTTPDYTFDPTGADENLFNDLFDTQLDPSLPNSVLTTPDIEGAASPTIEVLGGEYSCQLFTPLAYTEQLQPQQLVKDCLTPFSSSSPDPDPKIPFFQSSASFLPQPDLMSFSMEFSSASPDITGLLLVKPITDEEIAPYFKLPDMPPLNDPSMSMSGPVPNNITSTEPDMGMGWPMPPSSVSGSGSGSGSGYQQQLALPPVLPSTLSMPSPSPVPSACASSPLSLASPSTYSPRPADGDHGEASASTPASSRLHVCSEPGCSKGFATKSQLHKHAKCHTKPYPCSVCRVRFGSKKGVGRHMWVYHQEEAERQGIPNPNRACPVPGCSSKKRGDNLLRHIRSRHPEHPAAKRSPGSC